MDQPIFKNYKGTLPTNVLKNQRCGFELIVPDPNLQSQKKCCGSGSNVLDPDLIGSLDLYPDPDLQSGSGSGCRRAKMALKIKNG